MTWGEFKKIVDAKVPDGTEIQYIDVSSPLYQFTLTIDLPDEDDNLRIYG